VTGSDRGSHRSGFVCLVGRPNVGKSSLLNRLVSSKVAIVSDKPQTTRHAVRGILTLPEAQIVFVDTPGLHRPRDALGRRLNDVARDALRDVDEIVFVLDASERIGAGDAFIARALLDLSAPVICVVTKADLVTPPELLKQMEVARSLGSWRDVLTTSSKRGTGISDVVQALLAGLPEGPQYYPPESVSDQPQAVAVSEVIREKVLELLAEEVPHSVAVVVDEIEPGEAPDVLLVQASVYVERDSQKGIVIGKGGRMLSEIGSRARPDIEALLGSRVFLQLRVRVEPSWPRREGLLERFGY
jgi:GTP-binding protein Era